MLKYLIAGLLIALTWTMVLVLQQSIEIAVIVTAVVLLVLLGIFLYQKLWARRSAKKLEKGLSAQAEKYAEGVRPEDQVKIQTMKSEFTRAVASLKSSKLGGGGAAALYALPWYMIIGPPGAGKTTAIENSGLKFPSAKKKLRGVGGTRNCDWWLSNEAVILDTAGRYSTQDDDREEWVEFLDILRQSRPKKPLNGILAAISVGDLAGVDEDSVVELALRLKERIDEVTERLQMIFPVYVVLTKCDLLSGFVDMFGDLSKSNRGQTWGFTVNHQELTSTNPGDLLLERFDELQTIIERRAIHRLAIERRDEARERIFQFPQQFASLRMNLRVFTETLFAADVYQETPVLRGVYFTSGTQEGRPLDRIKHEMARALGVEPRMPKEEEIVEKKSYFLRDVFSKIIFPDQKMAVRTKQETRRQTMRDFALAGGAVVLAILLASIPIYTGSQQRKLVRGAHVIIQNIKERPEKYGFPLAEIAELREKMPGLCGVKDEGTAWYAVDSELYVRACQLYGYLFRQRVLYPLVSAGRGQMNTILGGVKQKKGAISGEEYGRLCRELKLHLLLTEGAEEGEVTLESGDENIREWAAAQLRESWKNQKIKGADEEEQASNVDFYLKLVTSKDVQPVKLKDERTQDLVVKARSALAQTSIAQTLLDQIIADVQGEYQEPELTFADVLDHLSSPYSSEKTIRKVFTLDGWNRFVRKRVMSSLDDCEPWVIADRESGTAPDPKQQMEELQRLYFSAYLKEWQDLVGSIEFNAPDSNEAKLRMIDNLIAGPTPPLKQLMKTIKRNAELEWPPEEKTALDKAGDEAEKMLAKQLEKKINAKAKKYGSKGVDITDDGAPKKEYIGAVYNPLIELAKFAVPIGDGGGAGDEAKASFDAIRDDLEKLRADFDAQVIRNPEDADKFKAKAKYSEEQAAAAIARSGGKWKSELTRLVLEPYRVLWAAGDAGGRDQLNLSWCNKVSSPFKDFKDNFPFNTHSQQDAPLDKVAAFFKPKTGALWEYYSTVLAQDIEQAGSKFRFRGDAAKRYNAQILTFLEKSQELSKLMFVGDAPSVKLQVTLHLVPGVEYVKLEVGGQKVEQRTGPERPKTLVWPGTGDSTLASIQARGRDKKGHDEQWERKEPNGEWAFFRLLSTGKAAPINARDLSVSWPMESLDNEPIKIDLKFTSDSPIFGTNPSGNPQFMAPFIATVRSFPRGLRGTGSCP